jgi:hypothetical protein
MRLSHLRWLVILSAFVISAAPLNAQNSNNYTLTTNTTASLATDANGNAISLAAAPNLIYNDAFYATSAMQPIGFEFVFMGKRYTHFTAATSGQVGLGLANSTPDIINSWSPNILLQNFAYPPTNNNAPLIAPFFDMHRAARTGMTIRTVTVGAPGNRCLVIQWNSVINASSTTTTDPADGQYQLRIYEQNNSFEFV